MAVALLLSVTKLLKSSICAARCIESASVVMGNMQSASRFALSVCASELSSGIVHAVNWDVELFDSLPLLLSLLPVLFSLLGGSRGVLPGREPLPPR